MVSEKNIFEKVYDDEGHHVIVIAHMALRLAKKCIRNLVIYYQ